MTPCPESITNPVNVLIATWGDVQDAAMASTAYIEGEGMGGEGWQLGEKAGFPFHWALFFCVWEGIVGTRIPNI